MPRFPSMVQTELDKLDSASSRAFLEEYRRRSRQVGVAYLAWFFLGWHYAYLGLWGWQVAYWLTGGFFVIGIFIDMFRIPGMVGAINRRAAVEAMRDLKIISSKETS